MQCPPYVDLRLEDVPILDQGTLGSSAANAVSSALQYAMMRRGIKNSTPSRLFIYYHQRLIDSNEAGINLTHQDTGGSVRATMKSIMKYKACDESHWPYDVSRFSDRPPEKCYRALLYNKIIYSSLDNEDVKAALLDECPVIFGFEVFDSFFSEQAKSTGELSVPGPSESSRGGHAALLLGYDDQRQIYLAQNSWGEKWGDRGYFYMPYKYFESHANDLWTIKSIG